jgi:hypothetical protein
MIPTLNIYENSKFRTIVSSKNNNRNDLSEQGPSRVPLDFYRLTPFVGMLLHRQAKYGFRLKISNVAFSRVDSVAFV